MFVDLSLSFTHTHCGTFTHTRAYTQRYDTHTHTYSNQYNLLNLQTTGSPSNKFTRHFSDDAKQIAASIRQGLFESSSEIEDDEGVDSFFKAETATSTSETQNDRKANMEFLDRLAREFTPEELAILKDRFAILTREDDLALGGVFSLRRSSFHEPDVNEEMTKRARERMRYIDFMARQKAYLYEEEESLHELERSDIVEFYFGMDRGSKQEGASSKESSSQPQRTKSVDEMKVLSREDSVLGAHYGGVAADTGVLDKHKLDREVQTEKEAKKVVVEKTQWIRKAEGWLK